ncbi:hypothetical protein Pint_20508 [Pistacia integerrima]|uniref:Uncharacterized protein n=1 Tax=Pistacia integerrima TaxID=434235 RepID=A0ACC0XDC9_9ROSI|nr:hypothetical protein Pint_20508 [Pistacia integerrima]
MAEKQRITVPRVKLGTQGFEVSKLGFGCMGLTGIYNDPVPEEVGISIIKHAFDQGITFFDTSDVYGPHTNELLVGKALKQLPREKVQLATKFGVVKINGSQLQTICGTPEYVRSCCEASLKRLDVEYIDLYYQHRIDTTVPIEDTVRTTKISNLDNNIGSLGVKLTDEELEEISAAIPINEVAGGRLINESFIRASWKFANTPAKESLTY